MSDSRSRDDRDLADAPNEEGFAGGATTPQVVEDRDTEDAERVAVPGDDLTTALSEAVDRDEGSTEDR